ncbi:hypothetical protein RHSIM_Rhsim05G0085000 [Rhododendron simsii]|uniref:KIB1-4 beta-propeller domain-containing protein n=1 Tax=Rhododendron simsii TaxID=118357 RepID=A0A834LNF1_RHOSS|nr:hypothetical protein RHSIM_Rhsim05G0085000 [Rhododendron simsii]
MVESEGKLFIIVRYVTVSTSDYRTGEVVGKGNKPRIGGTEKFRVYKVDLSNSALAELQSLGDNTLFVGYNGSISVQASNSSKGIRPNLWLLGMIEAWLLGMKAGLLVASVELYGSDSSIFDVLH